ncbi:MAG: hypothetical protein ACHQ9S_22755 [Candidatus Binatia bacterium]
MKVLPRRARGLRSGTYERRDRLEARKEASVGAQDVRALLAITEECRWTSLRCVSLEPCPRKVGSVRRVPVRILSSHRLRNLGMLTAHPAVVDDIGVDDDHFKPLRL